MKKQQVYGETPGMDALDFYFNQYKGKLDPYFGIKKVGQLYFLGDSEIHVLNNTIYIHHSAFKGSTGLWALIMENTPHTENVTIAEMEIYREILQETNALEVGLKNEHAKKTDKYQLITQLLLRKPEEEGKGYFFLVI